MTRTIAWAAILAIAVPRAARFFISAALMMALPAFAAAQWGSFVGKAVNDAAKRETSKGINQGADAAYDAAKSGVKGSNNQNTPPVTQQQPSPSNAASDGSRGTVQPGSVADSTQSGVVAAGEVYGNDFDFVPGDKLLFFDDFSDTDVGDSPMKFRGTGLAVVEMQGRRWALQNPPQNCGGQQFRLDVKDDFPKKFTVEFDAVFDDAFYAIRTPGSYPEHIFGVGGGASAIRSVKGGLVPPKGIQHVAASFNDTYVKLYVSGKRVFQHTDGLKRPLRGLALCMYGSSKSKPLITNIRIAEGGKDYGTELTSLGRIVTHGITFDSGADVLRPESGPTLRKILKLLQDESALRFEIQGHTDNQGGDKVNGPLSERRAVAVKNWLVKQGIEDARLTTKGFGSTKSISPNDTPEGRADNRRVEFVKPTGSS